MLAFSIIFGVLIAGYVGIAFLSKKGKEIEELERSDGNG